VAASELSIDPVATPDAGMGTTFAVHVEATVLEFGSVDDVIAAFMLVNSDQVIALLVGEPGVTIADAERVDLGDGGLLFIIEPEEPGDDVEGMLLVRDGNLGFIVSVRGTDETIADTLLAFGEFMVNAEPGADPVVLDGVSGSHGGTFDTLPSFDDTDVLNGLVLMYEYDLLASNHPIDHEATPAS
jgi:hypothetical protein